MSIDALIDQLRNILQQTATSYSPGVTILISLGIAVGLYLLVRFLFLGILIRKLALINNKWLEKIISARIPQLLTLLVPPVVIWVILPYFSLDTSDPTVSILSRLLAAYVALVIALILNGALQAINAYYNSLEYARTFPIASILDVVRVVLFALVAVIIISILFDIPSIYILTGIGALIATATVVFNNMILAFVAGLILTSKRLVVIGDWIEIPELQISGEVREITLTTVIIRNLDHAIVTVPSPYLLGKSFKNWRGAFEDNARQMRGTVYFDLNSIQPITAEMMDEIASLPYGSKFIRSESGNEIAENYRQTPYTEPFSSTNLGYFCNFLMFFLKNHPVVSPQYLLSAYLDAPTKFGVPLHYMVSFREANFVRFLDIQSEIMERIIQFAPRFKLKVYQFEERVIGADNLQIEN